MISPMSPLEGYQGVRERRMDRVGDWLHGTSEVENSNRARTRL